jgi:hypothetical protein
MPIFNTAGKTAYLEVRIVHKWVEEVCSLDEGQPRLVRQGHHRDSVPVGYLEVRIVHEWVEEVCSLNEGQPRLVRQGRHRDSVSGGKDRPRVGRRSL